MRPNASRRFLPLVRSWLLLCAALALSACASIMDRASQQLGRQLSKGVLDHDDPATVAAGLPAYLLLLDGLNSEGRPNPSRLCLAAELYGAYAGSFVAEPVRAKRLASRGFGYAQQAACASDGAWCAIASKPLEQVERVVSAARPGQIAALACLGHAWAGYIQAHADDWDAIAAIPKARTLIEKVVALDAGHREGLPQLYLGVMNSLLPPAYGGKPELAHAYFEEALDRSGGRNQMVRVLHARHYARMVFDQELHDRLLQEALAADPVAPGLTLMNMLAREQAAQLQSSAKDYFE